MIKKIITIVITSCSFLANSQTVLWQKSYGDADISGTFYDQGFSVVENSNSEYVGAGFRQSAPTNGQSDYFLVTVPSSGSSSVEYNYGTGGQDQAHGIIKTSDNFIVVCGESNTQANIMKLDNSGTVIWQQNYSGALLNSVIETNDGNYVAAGYKNVAGNKDLYLCKVNSSNGSIIWESAPSVSGEEIAYSVIETSNNEYIVAGTKNPTTNLDAYISRFNSVGGIVWQNTFGSPSFQDYAYDIIDLSAGGPESYAFTGKKANNFYLTKINGLGTQTFDQSYGTYSQQTAYSIIQLANGNLLLGGECTGFSVDAYIVELTQAGAFVAESAYDFDSFNDNLIRDMILTSDGNVVACGLMNDPNAYPDLHMFKLSYQVVLTDNDSDTYMSDVDCDDNNPNIHPGATEVCDLVDNDCDGQIDEGLATTTYYVDTDLDTYGTGTGVAYCANPGAGFATVGGDCNDNSATINPGATDIPNNGIDEDCVGGDATTTSTVVAVSDNGTCTENDVNASIAILANDLVNGATATISNAEVDIDLVTAGFQNTFTSVTPSVVWTYDGQFFGTLACDPGLNVEGTVTLDYRICEKTNLTNCSGTATVTVVIAPSTVSLDEQTIVFALFPNPTKDLLTISSANKVKAVSVIGLDGKVVLNVTETTINVASLTNGLYHIELMFDNGTIGRSTFMKN